MRTSTTRYLLTGMAMLCGLVAATAGGGALLSSADNLHDPAYRCDSVDQTAYTTCLEQAQLATPLHLHTGLWTATLAAAICAMVAITALVAHSRRTRLP